MTGCVIVYLKRYINFVSQHTANVKRQEESRFGREDHALTCEEWRRSLTMGLRSLTSSMPGEQIYILGLIHVLRVHSVSVSMTFLSKFAEQYEHSQR
jgi:hypothetical protein